ncbi:MAG: DUF2282 domain-containing protein [Rhodospirillaceae bacterium]|nr:DUF2282 domain-containing protein [Rhodospirillaceae bacterium]
MAKFDTFRDPFAAAVLTAALAAALASTSAVGAPNDGKGKEKCYGIAKAGENGCQSLSGSHTCGGCSTVDYSGEDWKWVPMGTCQDLGGQLTAFEGIGRPAQKTPIPPQR